MRPRIDHLRGDLDLAILRAVVAFAMPGGVYIFDLVRQLDNSRRYGDPNALSGRPMPSSVEVDYKAELQKITDVKEDQVKSLGIVYKNPIDIACKLTREERLLFFFLN